MFRIKYTTMDDEYEIIKLEKHDTKDIHDNHRNGSLTVVWRDWDKLLANDPKMVYVSSVNPGEIKGPHLHKKRSSYFTCIHGKVVFILKKMDNSYVEIESSSDDPILLKISAGIPSAHINISKDISRILTLADVAWKPNDNEMENVDFDQYNWQKWN
jgi:dTDP-4-dehydrorhamnose 3,5-epimerase